MRDRVAEVLAERRALERGPAKGFIVSAALHAGLVALLIVTATQRGRPVPASLVQIQFASAPAAPVAPAAVRASRPAEPKPVPKIEPPKPKIAEPKPVVEPPAKAPEKNTVPLSPFGRSTKKGSETPAPAPPPPPARTEAPGGAAATGVEIPIGGSGVTGLEGGDFPYTLYIGGMQRRIGANWFRPQIAAGAAAIVYFRIQRNGTISEARVEQSSGNPTFDRAALGAVRSSNPLNPLPPAYSGSWLGVHLTFR